MLIPQTNQRQKAAHIFDDLSAEEMLLMRDCMRNIKKHVDKNIARSNDAGQLARLLIFRRALRQ